MVSLNTALDGMQRVEAGFNRAAAKIARPGHNDSLASDSVDLLQSKNDFEANLKTVRVSDEMTKTTLDLLA